MLRIKTGYSNNIGARTMKPSLLTDIARRDADRLSTGGQHIATGHIRQTSVRARLSPGGQAAEVEDSSAGLGKVN
jgi:hypothetical protein